MYHSIIENEQGARLHYISEDMLAMARINKQWWHVIKDLDEAPSPEICKEYNILFTVDKTGVVYELEIETPS